MSMGLTIAGVALTATAILIWSITGLLSYRKNARQRTLPPPLPPQIGRNGPAGGLPPTDLRRSPPPLPPRAPYGARGVTSGQSMAHSPHPLPAARQRAAIDPRIYDYPKCPYHRLRNTPGKPQMIFWDNGKKVYHCCKGHDFTGGEH